MKNNRSTHIAIAALLVATGGVSAAALAQQQGGRNQHNDQQQGEQQDQDDAGDNEKGKPAKNQDRKRLDGQPHFQTAPGNKSNFGNKQNNATQKETNETQKKPDKVQKSQDQQPGFKKARENESVQEPARKTRDQNQTQDDRDQKEPWGDRNQNTTRDNRIPRNPVFNPPLANPPQDAGKKRDDTPPRVRVTPTGVPAGLEELKRKRVQKVEDGGKRVVIEEPDKRVIVKQDNRIVIQRDETSRIKLVAPNARFERRGDKTISTVDRPGGVKVISETDANGQLLRRYRRGKDGREYTIIDNRSSGKRRRKDNLGRNIAIGAGVGIGIVAGAAILDSIVNVPPPRVRIPRDKYIVDYERASDEDVYEALSAPPVDSYSDRYTLNEIRATQRLRERMRRVDLDDITFEFGSWDVDPSQYRKLGRIARAMQRVIDRDPDEVFLIEGYTDAVGTREDNLTLSDRRAEAVAVILSEQFQIPFENLTTQGYGEDYLKIPTLAPERANRRVAMRRITPLLARGDDGPSDDGAGRDDDSDAGPGDDRDDGPYDDRDDGPYDDRRR